MENLLWEWLGFYLFILFKSACDLRCGGLCEVV